MRAKSRILITGAAGFIGAHLARRCVALGHFVHGVVRPSSDTSRLHGAVALHRFDLREASMLRALLEDVRPETVFHLAASPRRPPCWNLDDIGAFVREDIEGLLLLLRLCAETSRPPQTMVRAGSLAEYGSAPVPYRETQREAPMTAYGAHLVAAAHLAAAAQPRLPFPVSTARLALVFGIGQSEDYLVPHLVSRCLAGQESVVLRPDDRRDLIYVDDAVSGLLQLAQVQSPAGLIVNLCSGCAPSMRAIAEEVVAATGADPQLVQFRNDGRPTGPELLRGSPALARDLLGWRASVSLATGLRRMVSHRRGASAGRHGITEAHLAGAQSHAQRQPTQGLRAGPGLQ